MNRIIEKFNLADAIIYIVLALFCFITVYPLWSIVLVSFSTPQAY